jgi:hypothetical protein
MHHKASYIALACWLGLSSCNHALYAPADLQVAPISGKGAHTVGGQVLLTSSGRGFGAQGLYAISDQFAVRGQLNAITGAGKRFVFGPTTTEEFKIRGTGLTAEASGGWYRHVNKRVQIGCWLGGNVNRVKYHFDQKFKSHFDFYRVFVQPECIFTGQYVDIGLGLRSSSINYYASLINANMPGALRSDFLYIRNRRQYQFNEVQLMLGGRKSEKYYFRNGITYMLNRPEGAFISRLQFATTITFTVPKGR